MNLIQQIVKDSGHGLSLFSEGEIAELNGRVIVKGGRDNPKYYVKCVKREKEVVLTPEELVRQLYAARLIGKYNYPKERLDFEYPIHFGREVKAINRGDGGRSAGQRRG